MKYLGAFALGLIVGAVAVLLWPDPVGSKALAAAKEVRAAAIESVTVYVPVVAAAKAESDRLGELVQLVGPTTLSVRLTPTSAPELVTVPAIVVQKMRADSVTIAKQAAQIIRLTDALRADSVVIRLLARKRKCGPKCGALIAVGAIVAVKLASDAVPDLFHRNRPPGVYLRVTVP